MGKESVVDIKGHKYRYGYNEETRRTEYIGPVGDAPALSEEDFARTWAGTTTKDPQDIISEVFSDLELLKKMLEDGEFEKAERLNDQMGKNIQLGMDIELFENMSEASKNLFIEMTIDEDKDRLISRKDAVSKYSELHVEGLITISPGHDPRVRRASLSPKGEEMADRIFD